MDCNSCHFGMFYGYLEFHHVNFSQVSSQALNQDLQHTAESGCEIEIELARSIWEVHFKGSGLLQSKIM